MVLEPPELRAAVVAHLRSAAAGGLPIGGDGAGDAAGVAAEAAEVAEADEAVIGRPRTVDAGSAAERQVATS